MDDPTDPSAPAWTAGRNAKQKNAVQRNVTALLNALAPERILTRGESVKAFIEAHRTPSGCVLQAPAAALSVSWFESETQTLGELHIVLWSGVVTRRGTRSRGDGATVIAEHVYAPIEPPNGTCVWRAKDGEEFDTASLATRCQGLLEGALAPGA